MGLLICRCGGAEELEVAADYESIGSYDGETLLGLRHGKGVYYYKNGDIYDGQWQRGTKCGYGVYTFKDGRQQKGYYCDDKYIGNTKDDVFPDPLEKNDDPSKHLNPLQKSHEDRLNLLLQRQEEGNKRREMRKKRREEVKMKYNL